MRQLCLDALVEEGDVDFDWRLSFPGEHLYTIDNIAAFVIQQNISPISSALPWQVIFPLYCHYRVSTTTTVLDNLPSTIIIITAIATIKVIIIDENYRILAPSGRRLSALTSNLPTWREKL